jgi:predicted nucleic acid-binding protein
VRIVDTSVLLAAADEADPDHDACVALLEQEDGPFVTSGAGGG